MKYFVLLTGSGEMPPWDDMSTDEQEAAVARHLAFDDACAVRIDVELVSGEALGDGSTATTMRTRGGELIITDGPFGEATEHIGGYYVIDAPDRDTVVDLCRLLPAYDIEIHPVLAVD